MTQSHPRLRAALVASFCLLAGCATTPASPGSPSVANSTEFRPVTIENCGMQITFERPAQRIITMNGHVTEALVAMGLGDRIVGRAYGEREPLPELKDQIERIPAMAKQYPTYEQILEANPDLVVGGMSSAFNEKEGRSREKLHEAGIKTFKFSEYCGTGFASLDLLKNDFSQLGKALAVEDGAAALISQIVKPMERLKDALAGATPVPVFFYDSGDAVPMTIGGVGAGHLVATYAGGKNIFADGDKPYIKSTWEQVAERSPEAIVVLDYGDKTAQQKIDYLVSHPVMATTPAVKNKRFVTIALSDLFENQRLVTSAYTVAKALHPTLVPAR